MLTSTLFTATILIFVQITEHRTKDILIDGNHMVNDNLGLGEQ